MTTSAKPSLRVVPDDPTVRGHHHVSVARTRLLRSLAQSGERVVAVCAPAGSGKSTLAGQWLEAWPGPHALLLLTAELDDPSRLADALPAVRRPGSLLVLDDVHVLTRPESHQVLRAFAEAVPEGSRLVLLSRSIAPAWLGRLRAEGDVRDVEAAELAFDIAEALELLGALGVPLADHEAAALVDRTDGWAAGLALLARSHVSSTGDDSSGEQHVADYVRTEMLDVLRDDDHVFLVRASVLDLLMDEACDAVLQRTDSACVLARLHDALLVTAEDLGADRVYRCNPLVLQVLREELGATEPALAVHLRVAAAHWSASRGDLDAAVAQAKAAGDLGLVGDLVWSGIGQCLGTGRLDLLVDRLAGLDDNDIDTDRWLSLAMAWAGLQTGHRDTLERWMRVAERHAGRDWRGRAASDEYAASVAHLVAVAGRGTLAESIELCGSARAGLPPDSPFHPALSFVEGMSRLLLREGTAGSALLKDAERTGRTMGVPIIEAHSVCWQGIVRIHEGDAPGGASAVLRSVALFRQYGLERLASSAISLSAQSLALALLHDRTAPDVLARARQVGAGVRDVAAWVDVLCPLLQARAAVALGDGLLARRLLTEARSAMTPELVDSLAADIATDVEASLRLLSVEGVSAASLTTAEMRVLQFLPSHLTFPQIGEHLFLTANTVKTHAHSIYRKLAVTSRDDAVLRARALGLIESPHEG